MASVLYFSRLLFACETKWIPGALGDLDVTGVFSNGNTIAEFFYLYTDDCYFWSSRIGGKRYFACSGVDAYLPGWAEGLCRSEAGIVGNMIIGRLHTMRQAIHQRVTIRVVGTIAERMCLPCTEVGDWWVQKLRAAVSGDDG